MMPELPSADHAHIACTGSEATTRGVMAQSYWRWWVKRGIDIVGALALLAICVPLLVLIALCVSLESPGPILFQQERIGFGRRPIVLRKFRTMVADAESRSAELRERSSDPDWLRLSNDPRITRVGRILRLTSLDELPQLWSVIRGDMSLVGPRPLTRTDDEHVPEWARVRNAVLPGITGLWQVSGRTNLSFQEMLALDYQYATHWSLRLDIALLLRTVPAVLSGNGAN
jgi:lipopolysaccharide/colanic/teichoic acid biosynthesis glycosyltransferase